ncbi:MAG: hypothetical protein KAS93_06085 [Gammaproteobacteria bacterium]|nr:hypothetical protein [Gammaproteobacteria bacterium]
MKLQRGYLLIVAVILIVIIGVIGSFLAYMFIGSTRSSANVLQSKQAFYLATSGLELAKRDVLANSVSCTSINGVTKYTNASLTGVNGQYTVAGSINNVSSTLAGGLSANATSIPLNGVIVASSTLAGGISASSTALSVVVGSAFPADGVVKIGDEYIGYSAKSGNILPNLVRGIAGTTAVSHSAGSSTTSGFFDSGAVSIDSELIAYNGISGSTLLNATRGVGGTTATGHGNGKAVTQNQCILTATAGVPTLNNPNALRVVQDVLPAIGGGGLGSIPGNVIPGFVSIQKPLLSGNAIVYNPEVTSASANFPGSTIVTANSKAGFSGNATTKIDYPPVVSSDSSGIKADVWVSNSDITASNLFNYYFGSAYDASTPLSGMTVYSSNTKFKKDIPNVGGTAVWVKANVNVSGNYVIGSPTKPVLLITTKSFRLSGNAKFYGFVYAAGGNIKLSGNAQVYGSMATPKRVKMSGNAHVEYSSTIIDGLNVPGGGAGSTYVGSISPQERFK